MNVEESRRQPFNRLQLSETPTRLREGKTCYSVFIAVVGSTVITFP